MAQAHVLHQIDISRLLIFLSCLDKIKFSKCKQNVFQFLSVADEAAE